MLKVRIKFRKYGIMKFIGHLDVMRFFQKAMRRADIPIAFTGGYSPHMIMSFAQPLGIGLTSDGEYMDIELAEPVSSERAVQTLNQVMTEGIEVVSFLQISEEKKHSGMTITAAADYLVTAKEGPAVPELWKEKADEFLALDSIMVLKKTKRSEKEMNIRPMIFEGHVDDHGFFMKLAAGSVENLKPDLVMDAFYEYAGADREPLQFRRLEMYARSSQDPDTFCSLESLGKRIE